MKNKGHGNCSDCAWYKVKEGCSVDRDSYVCRLNKAPRKKEKI